MNRSHIDHSIRGSNALESCSERRLDLLLVEWIQQRVHTARRAQLPVIPRCNDAHRNHRMPRPRVAAAFGHFVALRDVSPGGECAVWQDFSMDERWHRRLKAPPLRLRHIVSTLLLVRAMYHIAFYD